jgi:hypothetical protein
VASIGLAQILAFIELRIANDVLGFISLTGGFDPPLNWSIALDGKTLFGDEILMMLAMPPVLIFLAWFLLRTDAGIGVRAAAENAERALLLGIPIRRLSTIVWMIAGGLAALTFVLKAPSQGVSPGPALRQRHGDAARPGRRGRGPHGVAARRLRRRRGARRHRAGRPLEHHRHAHLPERRVPGGDPGGAPRPAGPCPGP